MQVLGILFYSIIFLFMGVCLGFEVEMAQTDSQVFSILSSSTTNKLATIVPDESVADLAVSDYFLFKYGIFPSAMPTENFINYKNLATPNSTLPNHTYPIQNQPDNQVNTPVPNPNRPLTQQVSPKPLSTAQSNLIANPIKLPINKIIPQPQTVHTPFPFSKPNMTVIGAPVVGVAYRNSLNYPIQNQAIMYQQEYFPIHIDTYSFEPEESKVSVSILYSR